MTGGYLVAEAVAAESQVLQESVSLQHRHCALHDSIREVVAIQVQVHQVVLLRAQLLQHCQCPSVAQVAALQRKHLHPSTSMRQFAPEHLIGKRLIIVKEQLVNSTSFLF